jgi:hypothetical protein
MRLRSADATVTESVPAKVGTGKRLTQMGYRLYTIVRLIRALCYA